MEERRQGEEGGREGEYKALREGRKTKRGDEEEDRRGNDKKKK